MDLSDQVVNATSGHVVSLLQLHQLRNSIPDDRSDSGLSSLRSGSGDERSGSRSSALSSTDEQPVVTATPQHLLSTSGNGSASSASSTSSQTHSANRSPLFAHSGVSPLDQVRVWRDPNLLLESEPHVRHVNRPIRRRDLSKSCNSFLSVQHQSLLMSHPSASASGGPPQTSSASAASLYPPAGAPNLISPHAHPSMHLPIAPVYLQDIWKHQQRYGGAHLLTPPTHTEELMERERAIIDRERMMMRERQHNELEKQKEKERQEREKHEREKQEKERQNQALQNHFEKSLRVAEQKQRGEQQWAPISGRPPQPRSSSMSEDDRKRAEQDLHQRHMTSMRPDQRDHRSYYPPVQRPTNAPAKSEYPPPPAHSRGSSKADKVHPTMQKAEHGLYGYAAHHQQFFEPKSKAAAGSKTEVLPNPPPLVSEAKTVIVKHDTKNQHHLEQRGQIAHSPGPKMRSDMLQHYLPASNQAPKSGIYDYRSQASLTPSPHHHSEGQNSKSPGHHRASQLQSPHHQTQRHSPHGHPSQQQQHQQHSSPDMRYRSVSESQAMIYPTTKSSANYPAFLSATTAAYAMPPQQTAAANAKPKVSSPAPHHFYGKPNVPQTQQLTAKPAASSPYQPASQYHPPHLQHAPPLNCLPPPAHSSRVDRYDQRLYSPGSLSRTSPPTAASAPVARSHAPYVSGVTPPPLPPHNVASVQTQPLDLGVANKYEAPAAAVSPKRKAAPCSLSPVCLEKKRKLDSPNQQQSLIFGGQQQLQLSRVSEASPLIASAATTITTVVNAAAYRTPPVTVTNNFPDLSVTAVNLEPETLTLNHPRSVSPIATVEESPGTPVKTPNPAPPSSVDSEKSNSPGPSKTASNSNYPVRHLKKAWLQRHTGEDVEDTTGVVGSGSCVTLPLNIKPTATAIPAAPAKDKENPVNSIHSIGSMAVNSINKTKNYNKGGNKKAAKETPAAAANGHPTAEPNKADDSSSSDQERGRKSPPKRKPPKVKRKKGAKKASGEEKKRKTGGNQSTVASESGSESEKESGSEKDSDSVASSGGGKKGAASGSNPPGGGKKRGRRPKSSKGEEPRAKKSKEDAPPQRDPFHKPPVGQLKKTGESFLQDGPCFEVAPKLAKCRECRWTPNQRSKNMPNIFCRFYAFRRLRYTKSGQLAIAGFSDPHKDALESDLKLWLPNTENPPADLDLETSRFLLKQVGDHFCDLLVQEKEAHAEHMSDDKIIAWKRVVQGVREMCDVCETTLFNFHWACGKCGFVVCLDCYKSRKSGTMKVWGEPGKDKDEFSWLLCTNRSVHEQEKLMLTQIIAGDSLRKLGRQVHEMRELWRVEQHCGCPQACPARSHKQIADAILSEKANGFKKDLKKEIKEERSSPLSWLADVALSNEEKPLKLKEESSSSSDSEEGNFSTLRELLIRPSHKPNGSRATSPNPQQKSAKKINPKGDTLDDVISSVIEDSVPKAAETSSERKSELKHFVRRYNWQTKGRAPIPIRIMTLTESQILYPDVPHSWLCDGKLLRLSDPINKANYKIFQDQWRRGQPVIVSDVTKNLERDLWNPEAFARDFGEDKNDLINCMTGNLVPNQPMKKFWEGFDHFSKRLKDDRGNPMLLKLKDWPPGEDFAEMLPSRFNDLMQVLPLSEYTHRSGRLNLASRLPECFVRPDLGPKMYNAYGSALHPSKGTTNLHLDISDAVNVMVYVGIPKDGDSDVHIKEAFRAIDEAGCDILTRRRVRDKGELPGALWHIYNARDADKIRDLLNKVVVEKGGALGAPPRPHTRSKLLSRWSFTRAVVQGVRGGGLRYSAVPGGCRFYPRRSAAPSAQFTQLHQSCGGFRLARERLALLPPHAGVQGSDRHAFQPRGQAADQEHHLPRGQRLALDAEQHLREARQR
ncbi:unnamed protein product [Brassicogethes aeneus]|uniref:JmjC domain-containing protein n=1 Tax=Brassicogethes aeneus TaxID=1431903 RepID=A0A9P0B2Q9_BRAAE|nr:unnamed protein product [Brassicogethes aeneus]